MKKLNLTTGLVIGLCVSAVIATGVLSFYSRGYSKTKAKDTVLGDEWYEPAEKYDFSQVNPDEILSLSFDYADNSFFEDVGIESVSSDQVSGELSGYLTAYPVYEKIMDRGVGKSDIVNVDYTCMDKETSYLVSGGARKNLLLDLGDNDLPQEVTDAFCGLLPGASFQKESVVEDPDGTFTGDDGEEIALAGRTLIFSFTINYICGAQRTEETLTDDDIKEVTEGDYNTVPEFLEFIRARLQESSVEEAAENVWDRWIPGCTIRDENKFNELVDLEFQYEMGFYQAMADARNMDMDSLAALYGCDNRRAFEEMVRDDSIRIVKQYLITFYIAQKEGILLGEAELLDRAEELVKEYGLDSVEELKEAYGGVEINLFLQMKRIDQWIAEEIYRRGEQ